MFCGSLSRRADMSDRRRQRPEGLRAADRGGPHVILVEDRLPDMPGPAVNVALRARTTAPILVLSGNADPDEIVGVLEAGADDHIRKPFHINELGSGLDRVFRAASTHRWVGWHQQERWTWPASPCY
jgi:DNA-binding response OmpR family regulator